MIPKVPRFKQIYIYEVSKIANVPREWSYFFKNIESSIYDVLKVA